MSFLAEWSDWFINNRFDWVNEAKRDVRGHLEHPFARQLISSGTNSNVNVALFGKTQVGKTTLILKLMGIKDEWFADISTLLRCGSEIGYSATPTAMIYGYSDDSMFTVDLHNTEKSSKDKQDTLDINKIEEILKQIRHKVESNQFNDANAIKIGIPKHYFYSSDDHIDMNIIDLPGLNSTSINEREWTKTLIKQFLPAANIVLVLDRGNQVAGFLDLFDDDELNRITNWKYFPQKYRVITTYSYSAESILKMFGECKNISHDDIVNHYKQEIQRSLSNDECEHLLIYPLEYGDSWVKFCNEKSASGLIKNIERINQYFFDTLKDDIKTSATELNQIAMLLKLKCAFELRKIELEREVESSQREFEKGLKQIEEHIEKLQLIIEEYGKKIAAIYISYEALKIPRINDAGFYYYEIHSNDSYNKNHLLQRIEDIRRFSQDDISNFEKEIFDIVNKLKSNCIIDDTIDQVVNENFRIIRDRVSGKVAEIYQYSISEINSIIHDKKIWFLGGPQNRHIDMLNNATEVLNEYRVNNLYNEVIMPHIGAIYDYLGSVCQDYDTRLKNSEIIRTDLMDLRKQKCEDHDKLNQELSENIRTLNADISRAALVSESIKKANNRYLDKYMKEHLESKGTKTLFHYMQHSQIRKDYESSLRTTGSNNGNV